MKQGELDGQVFEQRTINMPEYPTLQGLATRLRFVQKIIRKRTIQARLAREYAFLEYTDALRIERG